VIESDAALTELASFMGQPDLSCYSRAESESLNRTIQRSDTVQGEIRPRWDTTVVCGFLDDTTANSSERSAFDERPHPLISAFVAAVCDRAGQTS
jgi:hypothetical protein